MRRRKDWSRHWGRAVMRKGGRGCFFSEHEDGRTSTNMSIQKNWILASLLSGLAAMVLLVVASYLSTLFAVIVLLVGVAVFLIVLYFNPAGRYFRMATTLASSWLTIRGAPKYTNSVGLMGRSVTCSSRGQARRSTFQLLHCSRCSSCWTSLRQAQKASSGAAFAMCESLSVGKASPHL